MKVLIVDDHEVVRLGLRTLLEQHQELEIAGEAATAGEAVEKALKTRPDVVLMDVRLPDNSGIQACREIRAAEPEIRVLMLTSYSDDEAVIASVLAGASGYILKQIETDNLYEAVLAVGKGETLLDSVMTRKVLEKIRTTHGDEPDKGIKALTKREREILELIAEGMTNREIAEKVYLSEKTVRNYVSSLLHKLDISHRTQAAVYYLEKKREQGERQD